MHHFLQNRFVRAFLKLVVFSALTHIAILTYQSIQLGSLAPLNYFHMLDITYFFPGLAGNLTIDLISGGAALLVYILILTFSRTSEDERHPPRQ